MGMLSIAMHKEDPNYVIVGKVGSPYGVHGWLKIHPYTEPHHNILQYFPWYMLSTANQWQRIEVEESRLYKNGVIAKFPHIHTPEEARLLTGKNIAVTRSQLPKLKKNEYYWSDLLGLTVVNIKGEIYGKVIHLIATGANDVLVVKGTKEHAIPYLFGSVILEVDLAKQTILVDWELI